MPTTEKQVTPDKFKKFIDSCDFLDEAYRKEWEKKAEKLPKDSLQFVFKKFKDAKEKVETIYIAVALQHDPTGGDLIKETLKTIQKAL
jgi:RAB protein geranylgeranyltransferase component A